jgi:tetratricopeptide (TPR) repeat protein
MGLFGKIFGSDFASRKAEGDGHFAAERWGEAKLAYEGAVSRAREIPVSEVDTVRERIAVCRGHLARRHLDEARALAASGDRDAALDRLATAADLAPDDALRAEAQAVQDGLDRAEARAEEEDEVGEDELYAVLSGTWEDEQIDEYETYDDAIRSIVLLLHEQKGAEALAAIDALLEKAEDPCYLWFERARALLLLERKEEAASELRKFLGKLEPEEGPRVRAGAHDALARLAIDAGDDAAAETELRACVDALPDDVEPLVLFARFLRRKGRYDEALETAEAAVEKMGSLRPHLPAIRELGLALVAKGDDAQATQVLETAVELYASNDDFDFDPEFALTLARLHEKAGDPAHAADFYRHLAVGSDKPNHYRYNREAARLLEAAGRAADARRYLSRALELAPDDAAKTEVEAKLAALE